MSLKGSGSGCNQTEGQHELAAGILLRDRDAELPAVTKSKQNLHVSLMSGP